MVPSSVSHRLVVLLIVSSCVPLFVDSFLVRNPSHRYCARTSLYEMKRPLLDQIASFLFRLETDRVEKSSVRDDKGRMGEPMEWSESQSLANRFSELVAGNSLGYAFKQFVADIVAGNDYDREAVAEQVEEFVATAPTSVAMFSFSTCPFCRRAKDFLEDNDIPYVSMELDELEGNRGNEIRAVLGRKTRRTSVPAIFIGDEYIGGCNDGPGLLPLATSGKLTELLAAAAVKSSSSK